MAAGLGLALVEQGFGVELVDKGSWHTVEKASVFVAMLPDVDPSVAPAGAWKIAWVRNETDRWAGRTSLLGFDQVLASSELASRQLRRVTPRAVGVLPIGVDTELFNPGQEQESRSTTAVTTANFWGTMRDAHRALDLLPDSADVVMYGHLRGQAPDGLLRWHRAPVPYFALPDLYRSCGLVVDDMNVTTVGYGTLNSRFFESAACGSLPVVNGLLGVRELDLPTVPRYRNADELRDLLEHLRSVPVKVSEKAHELQELVRTKHSWVERARLFVDLIDQSRSEAATAAPRHALHFFPDYSFNNPFQSMLNASLSAADAYPVPVNNLLAHLRQRVEGTAEPGTVHVHWTAPILQWAPGPFRAYEALRDVTNAVEAFLGRGGRLIWTVHNALPHDARHRWAEQALLEILGSRAQLVHVLSPETPQEIADHVILEPNKTVVIEHSSYVGVYQDWVQRESARQRLGLLQSDKVLVALGGIRPYKGLGSLLDAFETMSRSDPSLRLLIAGKPGNYPVVDELRARCLEHPRIVSRFEHVPDGELQAWMRAADLAVLPYRQILNSGAFWLAQTFDLPVVAPSAGALRRWDAANHVRLFDPTTSSSLLATLRSAVRELVECPEGALTARLAAREAANARPPQRMAEEFAAAIAPHLVGDLGPRARN